MFEQSLANTEQTLTKDISRHGVKHSQGHPAVLVVSGFAQGTACSTAIKEGCREHHSGSWGRTGTAEKQYEREK